MNLLPEEIWLAGKGPSLDTYDWSKANEYRIGINETVYVIPECWGAIALDNRVFIKYKQNLNKNITVFVKDTKAYKFKKSIIWKRNKIIKNIFSTAVAAVQIFYYYGARKIHFVGFDSLSDMGGYAKCIKNIKGEGTNKDNYKTINRRLLQRIKELDIDAVWEHAKSFSSDKRRRTNRTEAR